MRSPTARESAVFDALVTHARPVILSEFSPDSCIASTRIGLDVLSYFGIVGREIPLKAVIFNSEAITLLNSGTSMQELQATMNSLSPTDEGGPWSIGLGAGAGTGWAGHLLIGVPTVGAVIDLSIDQANRPRKAIDLHPFWTVVDRPEWWAYDPTKPNPTGDPVAPISNDTDGVVMLLDRRPPDPKGYRTSPNWKRTTMGDSVVYRRLTGDIIRVMRADLDGG